MLPQLREKQSYSQLPSLLATALGENFSANYKKAGNSATTHLLSLFLSRSLHRRREESRFAKEERSEIQPSRNRCHESMEPRFLLAPIYFFSFSSPFTLLLPPPFLLLASLPYPSPLTSSQLHNNHTLDPEPRRTPGLERWERHKYYWRSKGCG